mgnify:CR=1 FL=1
MLKPILGLGLRKQQGIRGNPLDKRLLQPFLGLENIGGVHEDGHMMEIP